LIALALVIIGAIVTMLGGLPVAFAFLLGSIVLCIIYGLEMAGTVNAAYHIMNQWALLALPLFILLGTMMGRGGLAAKLVDFVNALVGRVRGGLGVVLVVTNTFFGAISGSAASALATIGTIMIPEMERLGYPKGYSTGLAISSSVLSLLIPPSVSMIIFGITGGISIPLLFAATLIPGLILTILLSIINIIMTRRMPTIQVAPKIGFAEQGKNIVRAGKKAFFVLLLPLIILGGIYSGMFTPTEAAAVAGVYAIVVGWFIYRILNLRTIGQTIIEAGGLTGCMIIVLFAFLMLSRILIVKEVPSQLLALVLSLSTNKYVILLLLNVVLMIMGMFMTDVPALILAAIVLLPVTNALGINPLHFGAICGVNLGMGLITPPVAPLLYLGGVVGGNLPLKEYIKPALYGIIFAFLPVILITTYVPAVSLTLPRLVIAIQR